MSFRRRIKYFLVHTLSYTNKEAQAFIDARKVLINGLDTDGNQLLDETSEIILNGTVVRERTEFVYIKFNKPEGYECSLNKNVPRNLTPFLVNYPPLAIAGRLDKASKGLLLLSNDGKWVQNICHPQYEKTKEYLVTLDKFPANEFREEFRRGVQIGSSRSLPCECAWVEGNTIRVILTEGKNRQIRRMCRRLGYEVQGLQRTRIDNWELSDLKEGESAEVQI